MRYCSKCKTGKLTQKNFTVENIFCRYTKNFSWLCIIFLVFLYITRTIHQLPIFEFVSFGILFGRQMSYDVMSLWKFFSILQFLFQISFSIFLVICPLGDMSIRPKVFGPDIFLVIYLSARCSFGHLSFGHLYFGHLSYHPTPLLSQQNRSFRTFCMQ